MVLFAVYLISSRDDNADLKNNRSHATRVTTTVATKQAASNPPVGKEKVGQSLTAKLDSAVSAEIRDFNQYVSENIDAQGLPINETILSDLQEQANEESVYHIANELQNLIKDPAKNQTNIRALHTYCSALKKRERSKTLYKVTKTDGNDAPTYFLQALQKSKICSIYRTENDPFWVALRLSREGDKLAQLFLVEDLGRAMEIGTVSPRLYPVKYNALREEVLGYLKSLSNQGVFRASVTLENLYETNRFLVPKDSVLAYYYAVLAKRQGYLGESLASSPEQLYDKLDDAQKLMADKMVRRIKQ